MIKTSIALIFTLVGLSTGNPMKYGGRIIGGEVAPPGAFPFLGSLQFGDSHMCGGFINTQKTVITAAHCLDWLASHMNITFIVGTNRLSEGGTRYNCAQRKIHQSYDPVTAANDVALCILDKPIVYTELVQPIAIGKDYVGGGELVTLGGWGSTVLGGNPPDQLQSVQLVTITHEACVQSFASIGWDDRVFPSSLCTFTKAGEGACHGDSGSPLIHKGRAVGIVSWGYPCAMGRPDVFGRVSSFYDWIEENKV